MRNHWRILSAALLLAIGSAVSRGQSVSDLLSKAAYQEKTAGDLDAAIGIYQEIINQEKASRPAVAQAHYRMGLCLVKKGESEKAAEAFRTVVKNYSDQKSLASAAQKELNKLGVESGAPASVNRLPVEKKIADLPPERDLSRPESAAAAYHRASGRMDAQAIANLSWVPIDAQDLDRRWKEAEPDDLKVYNQAQLDAEVIEVLTYGPDLAAVTTLLKFPPGVGRHPYSQRIFGQFAGEWKNLGEDRLPSLEAARESFDRKKDDVRANWQRLRNERGLTTRPARAAAGVQGLALLDEQTRSEVNHFEQSFAAFFRPDHAYQSASESEKAAIIEKWMIDAKSRDFNARTRAIAALGNVRAKQAVHVLLEIVDEPMNNHRPKWMAVRSLGKIGDPVAVPALIELVDHGNVNTKVYARAALAEITGVYFAADKAQWRQWWKERGSKVSDADKQQAEALASQAWKAWGTGQHAEAERLFQKSLARDPGVANSWSGLGWAQFNQNRPLAAKVSFEKALELEPGHAAALNGMGWAVKSEGKADEAMAYWKKAVDAQPGATGALAALARTSLEMNRAEDAVKYFEMWVKAEPNNEEARAGLEKARAAGKP